jgi:hypothetical protein
LTSSQPQDLLESFCWSVIGRQWLFEIVRREMASYKSVNGAWPDSALPIPTDQEALSGAKRLYRLVMKRKWPGKWKITSGRRYTYPRRFVFYVNSSSGWKSLVHGLSHHCHRRLHPKHKPHDPRGTHAFIERAMIEHVVNSGWLEGKLKRPEKETKPLRQVRQSRILTRITLWERKRKRAENALKRLHKQQRYYERITSEQASASE